MKTFKVDAACRFVPVSIIGSEATHTYKGYLPGANRTANFAAESSHIIAPSDCSNQG